ncbi:MAG: ABC transporter ATP-binding protein [Actinomycetia bacterium]|nr:ABC transporter ATP-binding protein [Actinomycetes bacterium]
MRLHQPGRYGPTPDASLSDVSDWSWKRTLRRIVFLARLTAPYRWRAAAVIVSLVATTASSLALPYLAKLAIDEGIGERDVSRLVVVVVAFLVAAVVAWAGALAQTYYTGWVGERVLADLRRTLFRHLQRLSLGYYERNRTGAVVSRVTNDIDALEQLVTDGVSSLFQNTVILFGSAVILVLLDWRLALATLAVFPLMAIGTALFRRLSSRAYRRLRERLASVMATLQEDISGVRVVRAFAREERSRTAFEGVNWTYRAAHQRTVFISGLYFPFVDFVAACTTAVVLGYGGYRVFGNSLTVGTLFAFIGYLANFFDLVQILSQVYNTFIAAVAALDRVIGVLDEEPEIVDRPGARELAAIEGHVRFDHVRFGYGDLPDLLHDLDLDIPAGTTVALVGPTGAGKSTIAKLLSRFYDPRAGRITIDGRDLRSVTQNSLRGTLGIVPQEGFLFAGSIRENIAFGKSDATPEEIERAARHVGAHDFIVELPGGYDADVGERGHRLSAGQRQLVAFARALIAEPALLILDEATSSVDVQTERRIERGLRTLLAGRTAIVIAHRLSTIRNADLIVVLEQGDIVEAGSHDELIARGGRYFALYDAWTRTAA